MYETHFQLARKPFAPYPEPDMIFWGEGHKMAETMLVYGLQATTGIVVITGEIGSGKTTLLNHLINSDETGHVLGRLNGAVGLGEDTAAWVLYGFGIDNDGLSTTQTVTRVQAFLSQAQGENRKAVLFIDEAQLLPEAILEELRLLSDQQINGQPVLQLVLLGQPELARILNQDQLLQFRQRIVSHYHLKEFTEDETRAYISSRLEKAGGNPALIAKDAMRTIHAKAGGIPRRINILCDTAFVYAFSQGDTQVTRQTIDKVVLDRSHHGMLELS